MSCEMASSVASRQISRERGQQLVALLEIEAAKRLVENREAHAGTKQRAAQAHPLAFAARDQSAAFAERSFEAIGKPLDHAASIPPRRWRSRSACRRRPASRSADFRRSGRFQSCTAGSTHAMCGRS